MKIYENGVIRDMTPEEIAEMEEVRLRYEAEIGRASCRERVYVLV